MRPIESLIHRPHRCHCRRRHTSKRSVIPSNTAVTVFFDLTAHKALPFQLISPLPPISPLEWQSTNAFAPKFCPFEWQSFRCDSAGMDGGRHVLEIIVGSL